MIPRSRLLRLSVLLTSATLASFPNASTAREMRVQHSHGEIASGPAAEAVDPRTRIVRANAAARVQPDRSSYFNAIQQYPYAEGALFQIYTAMAARLGGVTGAATKLRSFAALNDALDRLGSPPVAGEGPIDDHSADALLTAAWLRRVHKDRDLWHPPSLTPEIARTEGWTFGAL
ncbi:hypothetical protein [Erythrobacter donghaensis]|uniref:hypothetical protein n=1 Tax=Erythrobacter donghaensis TaxID=267135 RepID=UPI000AE9252D